MLVKLGDIAEVLISNVDKKSKPNEKEIKLCNFVDVYKNYAITDRMTSSFMVATASNQSIEKFTIKKGYLAITKDSETRDDIGIGTYFADDFDNLLLGYHCALIKPKNKLVYSKYLNAFIQSNFVRKYYELNASGSGQRYTLTLESILSTPILLPDYDKQVLIGDMLSNTDHQIERNNLMIKKLQVLTQSIYSYWFNQFEFPNEEGKPYKSSGGEMVWNEELKREIPKDWEVKQLKELSTIILGGTPSRNIDEYWNNGNISWLNSGEIVNFPIITSSEKITLAGLENSATEYMKSGTVVVSITGNIRASILGIDSCANQSVVGIIENKTLRKEYFCLLYTSDAADE